MLQNRLFFGDVIGLAFAQRDDLFHHLGVIAAPLGLGHQLFLLLGHVLLFRFQLFEPFDELAQFVGGHTVGVVCVGHENPSGRLFGQVWKPG
jgi:hypothetical protein